MIFSSFPIHSHLPLDLTEADFSMIRLLLLAIPIDCTKTDRSSSVCCLRKSCHVLVDTGPVICHLLALRLTQLQLAGIPENGEQNTEYMTMTVTLLC